MMTELKSSSPMSGDLSPSNRVSNPEEKEISDDDDDDRNHKHRRLETRSQCLEGDPLEQVLTQPYRERNRPFENGQVHLNSDRGLLKFEKRRTTGANFSRFSGRGRGRDSRFGNNDAAMPLSHTGPIPSGMFSGRGLSNVPNVPTTSWHNFGLIPMIPNGTIDAMNPLAMPILRSQLNPSLNMAILRQRCPDFEERGFCLRGDMCPMEHGVNRIVVEDVQSLSQFNLPVSLPSAHVMGSGFVPSVCVTSNAVINSSGAYGRPSKLTMDENALDKDGAFSGAGNVCGADVYDPDQPLWNNDTHDTSTQAFGLQPPKYDDESETLVNAPQSGAAVIASHTSNSSVWGRLSSPKSKFGTRPKPCEYQESRSKEIREASQVTGNQSFGPKTVGSTSKLLNDVGPNASDKSSKKAHRTLFVNCIPLKDNTKEKLVSHFRKFGEVIDIYIPANSERAFVQFSKREEAERALKAPDAVMGSRFIKLWWANRDNIPDEGVSSGNNNNMPAVAHKGKDNAQYAVSRVAKSNDLVSSGIESKPVQKRKMESLENLKEELRRKQQSLEQKRNEFRQQLDKLAKQGRGVKNEVSDEEAMKKQKVETSTDVLKAGKTVDAAVGSVEMFPSSRSKTNSASWLHDPQSLKQEALHPLTSGLPFHPNRYKLDNRPTAFQICAPLPAALANVTALKDHFKIYGDVSNVEIEGLNEEDSCKTEAVRKCSARVSFTTRHAAEKAFLNGKSWQDHNLQFMWVTPNVPSSSQNSSRDRSSALKGHINSEGQISHTDSQDIIDPNPSKIARISSNEPSSSDDSLRSNGSGNPPVAAQECLVALESHSPNYIPLETNEFENQDDDQAPQDDDMSDNGLEMEASDTILT